MKNMKTIKIKQNVVKELMIFKDLLNNSPP